MNTYTPKKAISLRINPALYEHLQLIARKENRSLNNFLETALSQLLNYQEPNEDTKKAIERGREEYKNSSLKKYTDVQAMFDDILAEDYE